MSCTTVKLKLKTSNAKVNLCINVVPLPVDAIGLNYTLNFTL